MVLCRIAKISWQSQRFNPRWRGVKLLLSPVVARLSETLERLATRTDAYSKEAVPIYEFALQIASEACETLHANCHPDADCSCEAPGLGMFLTRCNSALEYAKRDHGAEFCDNALNRIFWAVEDVVDASE